MFSLLQALTFITRPPGAWLYTLGLVVALEAPAALALSRWRQARQAGTADPWAGRLAAALGGLFGLRAVQLLAVLALPAGSPEALTVLPPLERAVTAASVLLLVWAISPESRRTDLGLAALGLGLAAALGLAWWWWGQGVALGAAYFNGTSDETAWLVANGLLLAGAVQRLATRRPPGWQTLAALLGLLLAAHLVHYLYPIAREDAPPLVRWAELLVLPLAATWLYRRGEAARSAPGATAAPPPRYSAARVIAETVLVAAAAYFVIELATGRFRVDGPSMQPNLWTGQYVLTDKLAYRLGPPQRGDVVVVRYAEDADDDHGADLIKRIIGLPGETVHIEAGVVAINGRRLYEPYVLEPPAYSGAWRLGPQEYFVLGDNRNNSSDSHVWGPLTREQLTGKALLVYWPPERWDVVRHYGWEE